MIIFKCGQTNIDRGGTKTILGHAGVLRAPAGKTQLQGEKTGALWERRQETLEGISSYFLLPYFDFNYIHT